MTAPQGWTAPGWEGVRDAFVANFETGAEVGAAFSAYHRGQKVVDLFGGVADPARDMFWAEDTLMPVFSSTKGLTAMCANRLADEGALDVDAPVVTYWPEFGQGGKEAVPVSFLLSHQVGLAYVDGTMTEDEALAWDPVIRALEVQVPNWEPGSMHGYHATTYGWLVGEVVRRISGRSLGTYLRDEIAGPLGADAWIGLPAEEEHRVGRLLSFGGVGPSLDAVGDAAAAGDTMMKMLDDLLGPDNMLAKALTAPGGALAAPGIWNERKMHAAEVPAANGITDARSLARLYAACIGEIDGFRVFGPEQMERARTQLTTGGDKLIFDLDLQFGLGFMLHFGLMPFGGPGSFGHFGMGGSVGWADPEAEMAIGYVMNKMDMGMVGDARSTNLVSACYAALA